MGNVYEAEEHEADAARQVFGKGVATVVFYDPDFPREGEPWCAVAQDAEGQWIGSRTEDEATVPGVVDLFAVVSRCGETVKFWLEIPERECEGHESLGGAHMGETVFCDGSCV